MNDISADVDVQRSIFDDDSFACVVSRLELVVPIVTAPPKAGRAQTPTRQISEDEGSEPPAKRRRIDESD